MENPIVVGTDGSPRAETAVEWAATEAARRGRRLHVLYAAMPRDYGLAYRWECWTVTGSPRPGTSSSPAPPSSLPRSPRMSP